MAEEGAVFYPIKREKEVELEGEDKMDRPTLLGLAGNREKVFMFRTI